MLTETHFGLVQTLTAFLCVAAVLCVVHQHLAFPSTNDWRGKGACDGLTLNAQRVFVTSAFLAAALPSVPNLFKR